MKRKLNLLFFIFMRGSDPFLKINSLVRNSKENHEIPKFNSIYFISIYFISSFQEFEMLRIMKIYNRTYQYIHNILHIHIQISSQQLGQKMQIETISYHQGRFPISSLVFFLRKLLFELRFAFLCFSLVIILNFSFKSVMKNH